MTPKRFTWDSRGKTAGGVFLILLLMLLVYFPALQGGFIWDDFRLVVHNRLLRAPDGLWSIWFRTQQADYFPLTATSFWLEWRSWGVWIAALVFAGHPVCVAAITTATAAGQGELARQIEARLKSYQGNQPWRAP